MAAACTAAYLQSFQDRLHLLSFEATRDGLILKTLSGSRWHWGQAPGAEPRGEASAEQKVKQLLDYCDLHGDLEKPVPCEHDVRPLD